eukprot:6188048-Pleurochrysis_carterae.AAC.1
MQSRHATLFAISTSPLLGLEPAFRLLQNEHSDSSEPAFRTVPFEDFQMVRTGRENCFSRASWICHGDEILVDLSRTGMRSELPRTGREI